MDSRTAERLDYLKNYSGCPIKIMEICGSHTAAISRSGLRSIISKRIELISGPGCPVCVTPKSYIDRLCGLAAEDNTKVFVFGDMMRVPGSEQNLSEAKGKGADVAYVYSPLDIIKPAKENPGKTFIFAAVGFETTVPAYALLLSEAEEAELKNIKILTSLKTMPEAVRYLCRENKEIDGFLAPGHVCAVAGYEEYEKIAEEYHRGFAVSGFEAEELVDSLYIMAKRLSESRTEGKSPEGFMVNAYPKAVSRSGNVKARDLVNEFFEPADAYWRGIGIIPGSGLVLRKEYMKYDAGSFLDGEEDAGKSPDGKCRCGEVICGKIRPTQCPLFGKGCTPGKPNGACMVSAEGACRAYFENLQ